VLFDEVDRFYAPTGECYYQQGDIVLAPHALLAPGTEPDEQRMGLGIPVRRRVWDGDEFELGVPSTVAEALLAPAMITSHDCTLDKEFNRRYRELRQSGRSKAEAIEEAGNDPSLDRLLNVAPIVPFEAAAPSATAQLKRNEVLGYFPVCESEERGVDAGVVDLLRETTIDRSLIVDRLAILSQEARAALRYALARFWVYRAPKLTFELEQAIGKQITDVRLSRDGTLALVLVLNDGSEMRLLQAPPEQSAGGPERPPMSEIRVDEA
jgi:hypothetical protein